MSDTPHAPDTTEAATGAASTPPPAAPRPRTRWWHHWRVILLVVVLAPMLAFAVFTVGALTWSYSDGDRAGTLQKFSRKGWLCKTWEGELMQPTAPGVAPTIWNFTVRDELIAQQVEGGLGARVVLHYREHRGVPSTCFGDTPYWVDDVRIEK